MTQIEEIQQKQVDLLVEINQLSDRGESTKTIYPLYEKLSNLNYQLNILQLQHIAKERQESRRSITSVYKTEARKPST